MDSGSAICQRLPRDSGADLEADKEGYWDTTTLTRALSSLSHSEAEREGEVEKEEQGLEAVEEDVQIRSEKTDGLPWLLEEQNEDSRLRVQRRVESAEAAYVIKRAEVARLKAQLCKLQLSLLQAETAECSEISRLQAELQAERAVRQIIEAASLDEHVRRESERECIICMEGGRTHAFFPCMHRCVCQGCALGVLVRTGHCPLCRAPSERVAHIYV